MSSTQQEKNRLLQFVLQSKNDLSAEEAELYELATLSGLVIDTSVFK